MPIDAQIARLDHGVEELAAAVVSLDEKSYLERLNGWSSRDIVAHLVGWNRLVIEGSRQITRGELPSYDVDPGENYSNVNAKLIREYPSTERHELLEELRTSARELGRFLKTLDADTWQRDFGVRHQDSIVTIRNTVEELIDDYDHHRRQIDEWTGRRAAPSATVFSLLAALQILPWA
ncbi:MAG: maleylpyruvate isomerase N-terminal domain-containing protein [Thermoanaerobaculia bacterium]